MSEDCVTPESGAWSQATLGTLLVLVTPRGYSGHESLTELNITRLVATIILEFAF